MAKITGPVTVDELARRIDPAAWRYHLGYDKITERRKMARTKAETLLRLYNIERV